MNRRMLRRNAMIMLASHAFAALATKVNDLTDRSEEHAPSRFVETTAPVRLFAVHKEAIVHYAHLIDGFMTDQQ